MGPGCDDLLWNEHFAPHQSSLGLYGKIGRLTGLSCREWHRRRSIVISGTSWEQSIRGRRRHRIYHLGYISQETKQRLGLGCIRIAADSTMLRMVNLFIALSLGVHLEQLEQRIGFTCPRPFLFRPLRIAISVQCTNCSQGFSLRCTFLDHGADLFAYLVMDVGVLAGLASISMLWLRTLIGQYLAYCPYLI